MKPVLPMVIFIIVIYLISCGDNSENLLIDGDKTCWNYIPLKSKWPIDEQSGICFFNDGKCFDYVTRSGLKVPFGNKIVDVSEFYLDEILSNWLVSGDSLFVGRRSYLMKAISVDTILLENSTDIIYLIKDNTHCETYWGHVIDKIPRKYID